MKPLVVVGDSLLDADVTGRADRLAPDAPAPVLEDLSERTRPGGAGLAALLAARSGRETVLVTAWGDDAAGRRLEGLLRQHLTVVRVPGGGSTPVKRRIRAKGQTLLRLDSGGRPAELGEPPHDLEGLLGDASGVLVSDYGRGVASHPSVRRALATAGRVPVVWDPHRRGAPAVPGARLLTPNDSELDALQPSTRRTDSDAVPGPRSDQARELAASWGAEAVAVTLGERGALLVTSDGVPSFFPAQAVTATDTCGAGDRFAATALVRLAGGALPSEAVADAVAEAASFVATGAAGGIGTEGSWPAGSTASTHDTDPAPHRGGLVATGGCFDLLHAGHVACLEAARSLGERLVVCLNSDASVARLKGPGRPVVPQDDRARVLRALACVDDVVVFDEDTPVEVLRRLRPDVWAKGGDYDESSLPEAPVLAEWGGRTVVLPYLSGRSTTDLVRAAGGERSSR